MARSRIEGLLISFPKLIIAGNQHTYVETDAVRYIYQPLEDLYLVVITNKQSNILQDIDTLHLFARTISEYCRSLKEADILRNAYDLIYAFDEVISLGYREPVNVAQIRTFTEMESHEEKLQEILQKNKEREALENAKLKAKQLEVQRREQAKRQAMNQFSSGMRSTASGFGNAMASGGSGGYSSLGQQSTARPLLGSTGSSGSMSGGLDSGATSVAMAPKRGMQLGSKPKTTEVFEAIRQDEGIADHMMDQPLVQALASTPPQVAAAAVAAAPAVTAPRSHQGPVHVQMDEKLVATLNRDGGLENLEVKGELTLRVSENEFAHIRLSLNPVTDANVQFKTHPHVDKNAWSSQFLIGTKDPSKPFPLNQPTPVLKYRYVSKDESMVPLAVNFWPTPSGSGTLDCSVEYELMADRFELRDVLVSIPLPCVFPILYSIHHDCRPTAGTPTIQNVDGNYQYTGRSLDWRIPIVDKDNRSGTLEFQVRGDDAAVFFPVRIQFSSLQSFCGLAVREVNHVDSQAAVAFTQDIQLMTENFQII